MISLQRISQGLVLVLFCLAVFAGSLTVFDWLEARFFIYLDPVLYLAGVISVGLILPGLAVFCLVLISSLFLGRFFCGYICPLGTTFDLLYKILPVAKKSKAGMRIDPGWKYLVLILILVSAFFGLNLSHWAAPLSLVSRFYALLIQPVSLFALQTLDVKICSSDCLVLAPPFKYQALLLLTGLFILFIVLNQNSKRFWCRYLCPVGGFLALLGNLSPVKRKVSDSCTNCGLCQIKCPMQAILSDPRKTDPSQCILCHTCLRVCPERAIDFGLGYRATASKRVWPARRKILGGISLGVFGAFLGRQGLKEYWSEKDKGRATSKALLRPPGSVPEPSFLNLCTRCGLCIKDCPSNMLQPALLESGFSGLFSPVVVARRGACSTDCNACGQICPTGAIRPLDIKEKAWAKMGTAVIDKKMCLAWTFGKSCLVCDEACPYGAVSLKRVEGIEVEVPEVRPSRCTGCGYCEYSCPVNGQSAIRVLPIWEMRLAEGSYIQAGKRMGLNISRQEKEAETDLQTLPPGFSD